MKFPFAAWRSRRSSSNEPSGAAAQGLGTFGGVYTPSILTILGVIMYLRFGWVVGNVGLVGSLLIVTLATAITFLTALSVCAIATDRVVRVGGAYYMISRSLGIETGGAVGISLYFAQGLSIALYTMGFAESVTQTFGHLDQTFVALVTTIAVAILALTSAEVAIKAQYVIMGAIILSLLSLVLGGNLPAVAPQGLGVTTGSVPFWSVFAVFFPAVTGIMAGVSMSGDLENPSQSIPKGTLAAVGTGYLIYMALPFLLSTRADTASLVNDSLVMQRLAIWQPAILLGVWGATLSSALGSILAAPRVLQALARDGVLPRWLAWLGNGSKEKDEPRIGTIVTLMIAIAAVCIGDLNLVAPVLTMFFLTTYLVLNLAAAIEGMLQSPSFRPTFKVKWIWSLLGAIGCLAVMVLINATATLAAAAIVLAIFFWLSQRELETTWGDVRRGMWMALVRFGLFQIDHAEDTKNWRPHVLVLSGTPTKRWPLIELAEALTHNRGLVTVASVLPEGSRDAEQKSNLERLIRDYLIKQNVQALVRIVTAADPFEGTLQLVSTYGLGPIVPNTIVLGASQDEKRQQQYCDMVTQLHQAKKNVVILRDHPQYGFAHRHQIDVWWGGMEANGGLMLLMAYLLGSNVAWRNATICLKFVVPDPNAAQAAEANIQALVSELRIGAIYQVIIADGRSFDEILHDSSRDADVVFLGMATPEQVDFAQYYPDFYQRTSGLPSVVYVMAAPGFAYGQVLGE
ncbi:amino acid permease [filamentous cyanobacterium LEGE 11480]|uniref:Amino acid permease n=1 Tax=Romeriopsis navalis LEGE 11480 TaxID=2777977 RepID=A0A928VRT7_9CYAN|nr:amino acid permease [Romeriopsis navalis]MBE9031004.1 amino acid permease [Romeriopsis navalis LEGE 11480]